MSVFPGPRAQIHRNEAGEPIGWDYPADDATSFWCDSCGFAHVGDCPTEDEDDDEPDDGDEPDFDEDAAISQAETRYEKWLGRT